MSKAEALAGGEKIHCRPRRRCVAFAGRRSECFQVTGSALSSFALRLSGLTKWKIGERR